MGDGVGSHRELYGTKVKKAHIFSAMTRPALPVEKRIAAGTGKNGMHILANRPIIRAQKHMRGSTNKLLNGAARENLLK